MLLNLQRGEGRLKAPELLAASYKQFQVEQALPALKQKVQQLQVRRLPEIAGHVYVCHQRNSLSTLCPKLCATLCDHDERLLTLPQLFDCCLEGSTGIVLSMID